MNGHARHEDQLLDEREGGVLAVEPPLGEEPIGPSAVMRAISGIVDRVAPTDATVLIWGESGVGKEVVSQRLYERSKRRDRPFVKVNCAALPVELLESELFGYERGAFTGAVAQKKGRLEMADGGVLFLDEIGELAPALQVKLLRVLQEREFERVGGNRPIHVDIRLIAATNRDLEEASRKGEFRQDLYFRLNVVSLTMPPLREHKEDIPMLVSFLGEKHCNKCGAKPKPLSRQALACLQNYDWPGNVRELENVIERALVLGTSEDILPEDLPENLLERDPAPGVGEAKYHGAVKELKKRLIQNALEEARGSITEAAKALGVHPNYLHRLIRNLDLKESSKASGVRGPGSKGPSARL